MGTTAQWVHVLAAGAFWGGFMLLGQIYGLTGVKKPSPLSFTILFWIAMGTFFGILSTFGWQRSFHTPLVFITLGLVVAALAIGRIGPLYRSRSRRSNS